MKGSLTFFRFFLGCMLILGTYSQVQQVPLHDNTVGGGHLGGEQQIQGQNQQHIVVTNGQEGNGNGIGLQPLHVQGQQQNQPHQQVDPLAQYFSATSQHNIPVSGVEVNQGSQNQIAANPVTPIAPVQQSQTPYYYEPYQYQPIAPPTPIPIPPEIIAIGTNKTISLLAGEAQKYLFPILESKQQSTLFFVVSPYSNVSYELTSIQLSTVQNGVSKSVNTCEDIGVNVCLLPGTMTKIGQQVQVEIKCSSDQTCMFDLQSYWSTAYPLHLNKPLVMDFQIDAYAKLFRIDVNNKVFKELRIQLTTKTVLEGDAPIHLYANFGTEAPTKQKHDYSGIHLWDDGLGIFIQSSKFTLGHRHLTIMVQGPASNVLQLQAKVITDYYKLLPLNTMEFDYLDSNQTRTYYINLSPNKTNLNLKLSTFTGSVQIQFYKDQQLNDLFMTGDFQSFGDRLYQLPANHLQQNGVKNRLYVKVTNNHNPSTYILKLTNITEKARQLSTDISDMGQLKQGEIVNYYVNTYIETTEKNPKVLKFTLHNVVGSGVPVFRLCHQKNQSNCFVEYGTYTANKSAYDQVKPNSVVSSGSTVIYKISLDASNFVLESHSSKFKRAIVSVVLAQESQDKFVYGLEYSDDSVVKTLRQGTPLKDRINLGSRRLYRVAPLSKDVVTVHIHLVDISGTVAMFGTQFDPRSETFQGQNMDVPIRNQLTYDANRIHSNQNIFIIIQGQQNAVFSLTVTFKRSVEISQSNQIKDKFNYIALPLNVQQEITIQPMTYEVVYLSTGFMVHEFSYTTSFGVNFCARKDNLKFPMEPYCDVKITSAKTELPSSKAYYISIGNPTNKTALVTVKYSNIFGCEEKNLGSPWKKYMEKPDTAACVRYNVHKNKPLQILTNLDNYAYPTMHSIIYINDYQHQLNTPYLFLDTNIFTEHCHAASCVVVIVFSNLTKSNVQVLAQYIDQEIGLLDGISQQIFTVASASVYKKFKFWIPNKEETNIILESKEGRFQFFVNVKDEYEGHLNEAVYPTRNNSMFKSKLPYYSLYNTLTISAAELQKINCTSCVLYISVVGAEQNYQEKARFIIEATQERRVLQTLKLTPGYLSNNSLHYYEYEFKKQSGSLVVSLSTENTNCANTYIKKGNEKATAERNDIKSYGDQTVLAATKGKYSITLEATKNCEYTISVSETRIKVSEIKQGIYKDLTLEKDQEAYLFYHHVVETNLKVISMEEYGEVMISVATMARSSIEALENVTKLDDKTLKQFEWPGNKDVMKISTTDKGFCTNCYYIIVIKALKKTLTSIMLYTANIDIPLTTGDEITDVITENQLMRYKMYTHHSKSVNISVTVLYGQIEFTVVGKNNQSKVFTKTNTTAEGWEVNILKELRESYLPTYFMVKGKKDAMYRFIIVSEEERSSVSNTRAMKFGLPTYLFLSPKVPTCGEATITEKEQKLLVSISRGEKKKLENITIQTKIGNTTIQTKNEIMESTMVVGLTNNQLYLPQSKTNITYCITSDSYTSLTLIPAATVTFLPENTEILVKKEQNLTLNAAGKMFVEIFQCEGNAHVLLSKQFIKLKGGTTDLNHWKRFGSNYLVELDETGLLYMNVDAPKALVRWQHINKDKGEGLGYYYYRATQFQYDSEGSKLQIQIPPLIPTDALKPNTTIQGVNFTFMVSDSKKILKSAVQCNIGGLFKESKFISSSQMNDTIRMSVDLSTLEQRFNSSNYVFASVVAELTLITPSNTTQIYKYIYEDQQISLKKTVVKVEDQHQKYGTWFWILWGATLVVIALYFLSRMALAKYRARHMRLTQGTDVQINEVDSIR